MFPGIRYAGRLVTDPLNNLGQGEAVMFAGTGSQTDTSNRWGDYSMTTVDPADGTSFWHANEYYVSTSSFNWHTRIGKFSFGTCGGGGGITLSAVVETKNDQRRVNLTWSPADGGDINVLRNSKIVQTTPDDGNTKDKIGTHTGTFTYQVCETDSGDCSNEVVVVVP